MTLDGLKNEPLELDADQLFSQSVLIYKLESLPVGSILRTAREKLGLSQNALAAKSGTTRHYISRHESGQTGFNFDTLEKIVQLGLGKKLALEIV